MPARLANRTAIRSLRSIVNPFLQTYSTDSGGIVWSQPVGNAMGFDRPPPGRPRDNSEMSQSAKPLFAAFLRG
jgi:hypothetical protein